MARRLQQAAFPLLILFGIILLAILGYRDLPGRPFAADDFQWLLNVRMLSFREVVGRAFDADAESHFYRPLIWLAFWMQWRLFGSDAGSYHMVSLVLHIANALLAGGLVYRLAAAGSPGANPRFWPWAGVLAGTMIMALHPAPFEAVVWVSAQSELLAALFLLGAAHFWLCAGPSCYRPAARRFRVAAATVALGLACLSKESAVVGLPLLVLLEWETARIAQRRPAVALLALPALITVAYLAAALSVASRNYLVRSDGYGIGAQLVLNPLRSLGLLVAPLPGVENGEAPWLPVPGAFLAIAWLVALMVGLWRGRPVARQASGLLALLVTLLPVAPFASPPDSRYLYLPVLMIALYVGRWAAGAVRVVVAPGTPGQVPHSDSNHAPAPGRRLAIGVAGVAVALLLIVPAVLEIQGREARFAAGARPGEELRRLAAQQCAAEQLNRMLIVEPPIAAAHAEAIVRLTCGARPRPIVVARHEIEDQLRTNTLVVVFEGGVPRVVLRTPPPE